MNAHTPEPIDGPYTYDPDTRMVEDAGGGLIATVASVDDFPCLDEDDDLDAIEADLNATGRLLAAAPDLLKALLNQQGACCGTVDEPPCQFCRASLAAIDKAEGRAS